MEEHCLEWCERIWVEGDGPVWGRETASKKIAEYMVLYSNSVILWGKKKFKCTDTHNAVEPQKNILFSQKPSTKGCILYDSIFGEVSKSRQD